MAQLWSDVVQEATTIIREVVHGLSKDVEVQVDGGSDADRETIEVVLKKDSRRARCIVTFEVWDVARSDQTEITDAFRSVLADLEKGSPAGAYLLTSRGLNSEATERTGDELRDIAAGVEGDVQAERVLGRPAE